MEIKSEQEFYDLIEKHTVLIDFIADWCAPCYEQGTILVENYGLLSNKFPQVHIATVDCDKLEKLADTYEIDFVPQIIIFKKSTPHKMQHGLKEIDKILEFLDSILH